MCYLRGGYVYSRGLFLPNVPGATFIQGGTFIPESRVCTLKVFTIKVGLIFQFPTFLLIKFLGQISKCGLLALIWL